MKREIPVGHGEQSVTTAKPNSITEGPYVGSTPTRGARTAREEVRQRQPRGAFDARAIREMSQAAPTDPRLLRRTIRRAELRQIVPLADSTIYELERKGEFPRRFFLTPRCVVWDLAEVEAWLQSRRRPDTTDVVKRAPVPDYRLRRTSR